MDKNEYKLKTEEMLELLDDGVYSSAAKIADEIDWRRVKNASMLSSVSDIYELNGEIQKSYDILKVAYERSAGGRKVVYRLGELALRIGDVDEAIEYYDEFVEIAPKDPNQYILRYEILRRQNAPIEEQIEALEEFKKAEYIERWAYELAKLYQEAGMVSECLEECDDLILWFSEGKYVYQAMELKMQYKPLTPSQLEKYNHRYDQQKAPARAKRSEFKNPKQKNSAPSAVEELSEVTSIPVDEDDEMEIDDREIEEPKETTSRTRSSIFSATMKLGEALDNLINGSDKDETENVVEDVEEESPIEEEPITPGIYMPPVDEDPEEVQEEVPVQPEETEQKKVASIMDAPTMRLPNTDEILAKMKEQNMEKQRETTAEEEQITGQISMADILTDWEDDSATKAEEKPAAPILPPDIQKLIDEIENGVSAEPDEEEMPEPVKPSEPETYENMGDTAEDLRLDDDPEEIEEDIYDFDEDEDDFEEETYEDEDDFEEEEDYEDEDDFEEDYEDEDDFEEETYEDEDDFEEEDYEDEDDFEEDYEDEDDFEEDDYEEDDFSELDDEDDLEDDFEEEEDFEDADLEEKIVAAATAAATATGVAKEKAPKKPEPLMDDREIPDDDMPDLLTQTAPLSRKETAKMIATGKTAPLPVDEISNAISMSDTGFIVHGRYDLETQSGIGTRAGLTEDQKKLFSYFVPVRGMSEQLVDVLEQDKNCNKRNGTSCTGNLLIIGRKGSGKTVLAVDVVKAIQKQRKIKQGKVAIVTGDALNKKRVSEILGKLYGGALIIEKAGKMNEKTVARLNKAMEGDTGELLIVLEEQRKPLDRLLTSNKEFRRKFTARLEVPIFINDELVTFGQTYARENGYRIDEMGILALYSRIDAMQREDHAVTVAEVKEIMDEAQEHSKKTSAKKLVKRVFGKSTDESDRIILSEKDFNI